MSSDLLLCFVCGAYTVRSRVASKPYMSLFADFET